MRQNYLQQTFNLDGKTALVTGSGRGIGNAIARALGRAGAKIVVNDLDGAVCEAAVRELVSEGIRARAAPFDVSSNDQVQQAQKQLIDAEWSVDILVSNAGNQNRKPVVDMTPAEWSGLMNVHVTGAFNCAQTFIPEMIKRGYGRIVMMSSVAGQATLPNIGAYATAKGAIAAFTRALAVEYAAYGINTNAIAPGFVRTDFTEALQKKPGFEDLIRQSVPCGRWANTDDIAPVVLFLVSSAASFINGQTIAIDGGMLARM
ncbi:MAG: short-chain dehydrogenase [Rhodoferax sp.]|nr:short-chain dehydrogenase [Rhodoferax sp.]